MLLDWFKRIYPARTLAITAVISVIVWFAGPVGTFDAMHPVFRLFYWSGLIIGSVPVAYSLRMADGAPIPVSRNHREKLEERGLI